MKDFSMNLHTNGTARMKTRGTAGLTRALFVILLVSFFIKPGFAQEGIKFLDRGLFLKIPDRTMGDMDPVMQRLMAGERLDAEKGDKVSFQNGKTEAWEEDTANGDHWFKGKSLRGGYALFVVNSEKEQTAILEGYSNDMVYVNGVPREGNKYGYKDTYPVWEASFNYSRIPIELRKGRNELLFVCYRGLLKAGLSTIKPQVLFNTADVTAPNFLVGEKIDYYASVVVINATEKPLEGAYLRAEGPSGVTGEGKVPLIQPMSLRKVAFKLRGPAPTSTDSVTIKLQILSGSNSDAKELASGSFDVETVPPTAVHNVTFVSDIDGSIQYYAVVPPRGPDNGKPKALFLSLHGADVIATNMAKSYYPKTWGYIVCPTNGGPYGFDWEDWGRMNALQVLNIAKSTYNIDPNRIYLTGHSMGGHGTEINGATYPDQFAAIGASAGWVTWWTYVFHHDTLSSPMSDMFRRATMPLNTYALKYNYKQLGFYILHGSVDDNVPTTESLHLVDTLKTFDKDFTFHEQMGVGHWWSLNDQAGADCVDWPPMFDFFARHARPEKSRILDIDFTTASPGVSASDYWLTIYTQERQLEPSRAQVRFIPSRNKFVGTTENIRTLSLDLSIANTSEKFVVDLDGTNLDSVLVAPGTDRLWLTKADGKWEAVSAPPSGDKDPARYGTFKDAFRNDVVFVYGTHGSKDENKWAFDKARFDAEFFWYQGNGSIDVVSDREFDPTACADRNVILYGNEETNSAWDKVLDKTPVDVRNDRIVFGNKVMKGSDLACFMVRPKKGSTTLSVGVVSGTGIKGMRMTYAVPYLQPGFALPDVTVLDGKEVNKGMFGAKVAGFFGLDWSLDNADLVWR